ncbi:phage portal protein [Candidatus Woesearchaeota archaeon]|nr:phage portal protein [Candidatus Woesearchaeota archaeon]
MGIRERITNLFGKAESPSDASMSTSDRQEDVFKAYIPWYLYKPPYGFPREVNPLQLRQLARNPYVFSVIKTLQDEVASVPFTIKLREEYIKEGFNEDTSARKQILNFFDNPNGNYESMEYILRCWVRDICELDSGVGVKVFDKFGRFSQLFARDGGTFLLNPDIFGYYGDRADFVRSPTQTLLTNNVPPKSSYRDNGNAYGMDKTTLDDLSERTKDAEYDQMYQERAAYFQYGWTAGARPVPFGKREILFIKMNPRTDSIYGRSPLEILYDQILTLVYGSEYNLDFYLNNNTPNGFLTVKGMGRDQAESYRQRLENQFMSEDDFGNFKKKHFRAPITSHEIVWTPLQMSSKEMQVLEQQKWFSKLVWSCFGVTPEEMGFTEDSNKAVAEHQGEVAKRRAVKPFLSAIEYAINNQLMPEFGHPEYEFKFVDYDLDEDVKKHQLWESQIRMGVRTSNEIRVEELGLDEMDETQLVEGEQQDEEPDKEEKDKDKDKEKKLEKKAYEDKFLKDIKETPLEKSLMANLNVLDDMIMEEVRFQFNENKLGEIKGYVDIKSRIEDSLAKFKNFFDSIFKRRMTEQLEDQFEEGVDEFESKFQINTQPEKEDLGEFNDYVFENIQDLNEELVNKLRQAISRAILNKATLEQATEQVRDVLDTTKDRAKMIARTETVRARNMGHKAAAESSGLKLKKQWDASLDLRTSEVCRNLDGEIIEMNEKFKYKGEEFDLPPAHPNCRSRVIYIQDD